MLRATTLRGRSVVDLDSATKLGNLAELIIDPEGRHVAGLVVAEGQALLGERHERLLPAAAVNAIGPDAVTVHGDRGEGAETDHLGNLPRLAMITGRKVVSHDGRFLGVIGDVLIAPEDGSVLGYALGGAAAASRLESLFGGGQASNDDNAGYIRADADLRVGPDLIVVPDDAVASDLQPEGQAVEPNTGAPRTAPIRWRVRAPGVGRSEWLPEGTPAPTDTPDVHSAPTRTVETPINSASARPVQSVASQE